MESIGSTPVLQRVRQRAKDQSQAAAGSSREGRKDKSGCERPSVGPERLIWGPEVF